jgi:hypothetical protein
MFLLCARTNDRAEESTPDVIEIGLADTLHRIHREMYVDSLPHGLANFTVIDAEGARQIVMFHEPLMLAAPERR